MPAPLRGDLVPITGQEDIVPGVATNPTTSADGINIPSGYNYMTVHVHDNASATRIVGAETADIELWFHNPRTGIWTHNPADDFDAVGRGSADGTHDCEVFHIPNSFNRVYFNKSSGNTLWIDVLFSKDLS